MVFICLDIDILPLIRTEGFLELFDDIGTDLIFLGRNRGADDADEIARIRTMFSKDRDRLAGDPPNGSLPTGVYQRDTLAKGVCQIDRNAVCEGGGEGNSLFICPQSIDTGQFGSAFLAKRNAGISLADFRSMYLICHNDMIQVRG